MEFLDQVIEANAQPRDMPSYSFYNGTITVFYDDKEHTYMRFVVEEPHIIDGVTTAVHIIDKSPALTQWAANMTRDAAFAKLEPGKAYTQDEIITILNEAAKHFKEYTEMAADIGKIAHDALEQGIKAAMATNKGVLENFHIEFPKAGKKKQGDNEIDVTEEMAEKAKHCVLHALNWCHRHNVRFIFTERKIYSRKYDYAGTMDGLALVDNCDDPKCCGKVVWDFDEKMLPIPKRVLWEFKDVLAVIDWKSSNGLYDEYRFQTAAYENAHEEEFEVDITDRFVLRLGKTEGDFEPWHIGPEDFEMDFQAFLHALDLHRDVRAVAERGRERKATIRELKKQETKERNAAKKAAAKVEKLRLKREKEAAKIVAKVVESVGAEPVPVSL